MDFLSLLSAMEYKTLNARNVEILRSAYAVQDENIQLLKSANATLVENASLLRRRVEQLAAELAALRRDHESLQQSLPPQVELLPSSAARAILQLFSDRGVTQINDKCDVAEISRSRPVVEEAFDELCAAKLVTPSSLGEHGCWFTLTGYGKEFLSDHAAHHRPRAPDVTRPAPPNSAAAGRNPSPCDAVEGLAVDLSHTT